MDQPGETGKGMFASLRRVLKTVSAIVENRLELLLVEARAEQLLLFDTLLLLGVVLILVAMALMMFTMTVVMLCLKYERFDLLIALMLAYLVATAIGVWRLRIRLKGWAPFSATLAELKKDKACLEEKS